MTNVCQSFIQPDNAIKTDRNGSKNWALVGEIISGPVQSYVASSAESQTSNFRTLRGSLTRNR